MTSLTFSVVTLGCKVNQYETESIAREMGLSGHRDVGGKPDAGIDKPDICIVNTCTVTQKASMQSRQAVRQAIRANPDAVVVVTGCLAQTAPHEIRKIDGVGCIVGHADKYRIPEIVSSLKSGQTPQQQFIHRGIREGSIFQDMSVPAMGNRTRPFLKIQDGCDAFCTYCIVPFARGPNRSMPLERVVNHVKEIQTAGYHEIVLTGIHLGRYGTDLTPTVDLTHLLQRLKSDTAIDRMRLSSVEPLEVTPDLIQLMVHSQGRPGQICPHWHIPLQSGDDDILKRMRRPYGRDDFQRLVLRIVETLPQAAIGADVLIGFPGESDEAFANTVDLLEELPLAYLHVFPFSPRKGTPAAEFPDRVPSKIVKERCRQIRRLGVRKKRAFVEKWLRREMEVLVETTRDPRSGLLKGVTANYIKVMLDGPDRLRNTFQTVRIEDLFDDQALMGRLINP